MPERQSSPQLMADPALAAQALEPVRKSIRVRASASHAFHVFAEAMDSWWPRSHHIGKSPMQRVVVEGRPGGAIYNEQEDGTLCPWGSVLAWEPPHRFLMAWQITADWQFEPDLAKCSQVEVRFTPADDGTTLVELEHSGMERHDGNCARMRDQIDSDRGWSSLLVVFAATAGGAA